MLFSEIPGQGAVKANLVNLVRSNRLSHALLLLGKEGSGALQLALALSQYVVCEKNKPGTTNGEPSLFGVPTQTTTFLEDSCGNCPSCKKAAGLIHPDIHFSFPTIVKTAGDKPRPLLAMHLIGFSALELKTNREILPHTNVKKSSEN